MEKTVPGTLATPGSRLAPTSCSNDATTRNIGVAPQPSLLDLIPAAPRFDGSDYWPDRDDERLSGQYGRVFGLMADGRWRTLRQIEDVTHDPEASISAQLRHSRKPRFGAHTINKRYEGDGLYYYQLIVNPDAARIMAACSKRQRKVAS